MSIVQDGIPVASFSAIALFQLVSLLHTLLLAQLLRFRSLPGAVSFISTTIASSILQSPLLPYHTLPGSSMAILASHLIAMDCYLYAFRITCPIFGDSSRSWRSRSRRKTSAILLFPPF